MLKVRVLVEHQYETVQDYMKNEKFGFRFHHIEQDKIIFSIFDIDPVSRVVENFGFFTIPFKEFESAFSGDENVLREYVAVNAHLVKSTES